VVQLTNELARQNKEIEERTKTEKVLRQAVQDTGEALLRNGKLAEQLPRIFACLYKPDYSMG
ncbi:hypothetical protein ACLI10_15220, partial [Enterococcus faecalis]|uniref:hypothetical protein n=1 Tax=Enterococcus faecalis TaxID=1351 RepID=UPI0039846907